MSGTLRKPICVGCPHDLHFGEFVPKRQYGVMMHCGERFCIGGKRARRFKRGDPKVNVPDWCPKRKTPCELRVYGFRDDGEWYLHTQMCLISGTPISPSGFRYALKTESRTELTPYEFWKRCDCEPYKDLLGISLQQYEVLEIDDGLKPAFFYMTEDGLVLEPHFEAERARENRRRN